MGHIRPAMPWLLLLFVLPSLQVEIPQKWREVCAFTDIPLRGVEGQFNHSQFNLRGLGILFRHGERSGLLEYSDETGCAPYRQDDDERFIQLENLVASEDFRTFMGISEEKLGSYTPIPERARCASGQMTAEGAVQHVLLGDFLLKQYTDRGLFDKGASPSVTVTTTNYNRTLQSAVAFSSSFLFPQKEKLTNITFVVANNTLLCFDPGCHCPYAQNLWKKAHREEHSTFLELASERVRNIVSRTKDISEFFDCHLPLQVLDTALTRFVCRRKDLPCNGSFCLSFDDLQQLHNFTSVRSSHWYNNTEKYMRGPVDDIKSINFLSALLGEVDQLPEKTADATFTRIVSAHDVSLAAVFHSLGVDFEDPLRYVSRLIFEIFEHTNGGFHFRMLLNGVDYTKKLPVCGELEEGLCAVDKLREERRRLVEKVKSVREKCLLD